MKSYIHNLGTLFDSVAKTFGDKTAIQFPGGERLTFAELDDLSDRMAGVIRSHGLKQYDVCVIAGVKKPHTYVSLIACVKLGVTYSFFDPESPAERLTKIFRQCSPRLVLGYFDEVEADITGMRYPMLDLGTADIRAAEISAPALTMTEVEGSTPSYIMFTSGSTGFPKGAVMTHSNVINFIHWSRDTFDITPGDIHTNINPLYFDNSVFDVYASLFNGAMLIPITKKEAIHPGTLLNILEQQQCTTWFSVPSMLIYLQTSKAIIPQRWRFVKKIIFGGEGYPKARLVNLFNALKHNTTICNVYGPTECTCICSSYTVGDSDFTDLNGFLPLGAMAENFSWYIVDEQGRQTKEKGDLFLGGPNVGLGYYNDPERTAERFVQNPFHNRYKDIFYRTGDLVSYNEQDGKIYIHGRTDHQVKHMGYRIELEEIENAICQVKGINEAAAFVIGESNNNKIFAVYESTDEVTPASVKDELKKLLPSYMIPGEVIRIDRIPKNANGKTDRLSLTKTYQQWPK